MTINGTGTLTATGGEVTGQNHDSYGVNAVSTVTVNGTLNAMGGTAKHWSSGINAAGDINVKEGSTLTSIGGTADDASYGVRATGNVTVSGTMIATGNTQAIGGNVKNTATGTGWTDTAGTQGQDSIPVSTEGQTIRADFKKVYFHGHVFTYSAAGATITATCVAEGCPLPPSTEGGSDHVATLTITAEGGIYDGRAYSATITETYRIQGDAKVQYQKKTGESTYDTATETAPTEAGDYRASITLGEATASVEYSIATPYRLWVGDVQVTSANKDNVLEYSIAMIKISSTAFYQLDLNPTAFYKFGLNFITERVAQNRLFSAFYQFDLNNVTDST